MWDDVQIIETNELCVCCVAVAGCGGCTRHRVALTILYITIITVGLVLGLSVVGNMPRAERVNGVP